MKTLFGRSLTLAADIFIFSIIEWVLFFGAIFCAFNLMHNFLEQEVIQFIMPLLWPLLLPALLAMALSQMRTALLRLHQTSALDFKKIYSYVFSLIRFVAILAPLVIACIGGLLAIMYWKGLFTFNEIMFIGATIQAGEPYMSLGLFTSGPRFAYLCLMIFVLMLSLSTIMIPMAASAAALGERATYYDPFYGFGQMAIPLVNATILVIALSAALIYVDGKLFIYLHDLFRASHGANLPTMEANILEYGPYVFAFLAFVWTSSIWFSAAVLAFIDYREQEADRHFKLQRAKFGEPREATA